MYSLKVKTKKGIVIFSILVIVFFSFLSPKKAEAGIPVVDLGENLKDYALDNIPYIIGKLVLKKLTAQIVGWINSGFKGNPAYLTDPNSFFLDVGDQAASQLLSNTSLSRLCTPFRAQIRIAVAKNYLTESDNIGYCTLGQIADNFDNFTNDFSSGGWDAFFTVTQNSQNNPYGSYMNTKHQLGVDVAGVGVKYQKQLEQGNGFLSFEKCKPGTEQKAVAALDGSGRLNTTPTLECQVKADWSTVPKNPITGLPVGEPACLKYYPVREEVIDTGLAVGDCKPGDKETVTPGSVISGQLENVFGSGVRKLEAADEINEIVGALINQLAETLVGGLGKGLRGMTQKTAANPRTYIEQIANESPESQKEDTEIKAGVKKNVDDFAKEVKKVDDASRQQSPADTPIIVLRGSSPMDVSQGTSFSDLGADAFDPKTNTTVFITSPDSVDTSISGVSHTITYTFTSLSGVPATPIQRVVNIVP